MALSGSYSILGPASKKWDWNVHRHASSHICYHAECTGGGGCSYMVAGRPYRGACWYKAPECMLGAWPYVRPGTRLLPELPYSGRVNLGQGLSFRGKSSHDTVSL